jgi:hypothetical protein
MQYHKPQDCVSSPLLHSELCSSLWEFHSFLSLPADTMMTSSRKARNLPKWLKERWHFAFIEAYRSLPELWNTENRHFDCELRFWLWPKVTIPHSHGQEDSQKRQKNWQTWLKTCAVPENIQFSFLCNSFYTVKRHGLSVSVWARHLFPSKFLFLSFSHGSRTEKEVLQRYSTSVTFLFFLTLCEQCQVKKKTPKRRLVVRPILAGCMNSRRQVDLIDMQTEPDGCYRFIMNYQDHLTK